MESSPVRDGVILGCVKNGIKTEYIPTIERLVREANPSLGKAEQLWKEGKVNGKNV